MDKPSTEEIVAEQPMVGCEDQAVTDRAVNEIQADVSDNVPPILDDNLNMDSALPPDAFALTEGDPTTKNPVDLQRFRESSALALCKHYGHIRTALLAGETAKIASEILPPDLINVCKSLTPKDFTPTIQEKAKALAVALEQDAGCDYEPLLREIMEELKSLTVYLSKQRKPAFKSNAEQDFARYSMLSYILLRISKIGFGDVKQLEDLMVSDEVYNCLSFIQSQQKPLQHLLGNFLRALPLLFLPLPQLKCPSLSMAFSITMSCINNIRRSVAVIGGLYLYRKDFKDEKFYKRQGIFGGTLLRSHIKAVFKNGITMPIAIVADLVGLALRPLFQIIGYMVLTGLVVGLLPFAVLLKLFRLKYSKVAKANKAEVQELAAILKDVYTQALGLQPAEQKGEKTSADLLPLFKDASLVVLFRMMKKFNFPYPEISSSAELIDSDKATVLIIGTGEDSLALAREIDRQGQVNVVLCDLVGDFVEKRGGKKVFVKKGIVYKNGEIHETRLKKPVEADYILSEMWGAGNGSISAKGKVPLAGMPFISEYTENKEVTKTLLQGAGVTTALSICFRRPKDGAKILDRMVGSGMLKYAGGRDKHEIEFNLEEFCWDNRCQEIVVKPTDGECGGGCQFF